MNPSYDCPLFSIDVHHDAGVFLYRRKPGAAQVDQLAEEWKKAIAALLTEGTREYSIILDARKVAGRNDDAFESQASSAQKQLNAIFRRVILLLGTQAGVLQQQRMVRESGEERLFTTDEAEAWRWAKEKDAPKGPKG